MPSYNRTLRTIEVSWEKYVIHLKVFILEVPRKCGVLFLERYKLGSFVSGMQALLFWGRINAFLLRGVTNAGIKRLFLE